jgi:predicted GIY-YIG superfamily endonuclease
MLLCSDNTYYTGHTEDLENRINEHHTGGKCRYTSPRRPLKLVWSQNFTTRQEAKAAERQIKNWSQSKKKALIGTQWNLLSTLARSRDDS